MIYVAELTQEQAEQLSGERYNDSSYFNPFEISGKWYISELEVLNCTTLLWVRRLPLIQIEIVEDEGGNLIS